MESFRLYIVVGRFLSLFLAFALLNKTSATVCGFPKWPFGVYENHEELVDDDDYLKALRKREKKERTSRRIRIMVSIRVYFFSFFRL